MGHQSEEYSWKKQKLLSVLELTATLWEHLNCFCCLNSFLNI